MSCIKYIGQLLVQWINLGSNQGFINLILKLVRSDFSDVYKTMLFLMLSNQPFFRPIFGHSLVTKKKDGVR